jgi:hypothetical protein
MLFGIIRRLRSFFAAAAIVTAALSAAQTLQQRPTAKPAAPVAPRPLQVDGKPELPEGTSLQVEIPRAYPVKAAETIQCRLLHPIYANGKLVVPENTMLRGKVVALEADTKARWHARLRGDFTPLHTVQIRFDELMLPSGPLPIVGSIASNGAPVLYLSAPGASPRRSFVAREWAQAKSTLHDRIAVFTAPGKKDRAMQVLYHQLPYHPERIEAHTAWSFELQQPLELSAVPPPPQPAVVSAMAGNAGSAGNPETWSVHALLMRDLSSARAKSGDPVQALVVEPVYDKDKQLVVPQGSTLIGKVTSSRAARSLGRNGKLRFTFQQVDFPEGYKRPVEGSLAGAATEKTQNLSLDAEGTISPRNQSSAIAPLLLTLLAGRALDSDGNLTAGTGVASNGFGLIGRIVGVTAANRDLAAGIGYYAAALSFYENFLRSGRDVVFPKDTRIEIETTPLRAPVLTPQGQ